MLFSGSLIKIFFADPVAESCLDLNSKLEKSKISELKSYAKYVFKFKNSVEEYLGVALSLPASNSIIPFISRIFAPLSKEVIMDALTFVSKLRSQLRAGI